MNAWHLARQACQVGALLLVLVLLVGAPRLGEQAYWSNPLLRLDPFAAFAAWLSGGSEVNGLATSFNHLPWWSWIVGVLAASLLLGRAWCGWLCPLGTLLDWTKPKADAKISQLRSQKLEGWRKVKFLLLVISLGGAMLGLGGIGIRLAIAQRGSLLWLVLDPLAIFIRAFSGLMPGINILVTGLELVLYKLPFLQPAVSWLDGLLRPAILPVEAIYAKDGIYAVLLLAGLVTLNWIVPRFWCRYLCPLGGLLAWVSRFSLLRRQVDIEDCTGCKLCARACPTGTIDIERGYASDPAECTLCLDCIPACPRGDTAFRWVNPLSRENRLWPAYDPTRRQAIAAFGVGLAATVLLATDLSGSPADPGPLRPPGATEFHLLSRCVRCGLCLRSCPTGALQPAISEAGFEGLWTPVLMPRLGYCDFSCHACGLACPEGAIPPLSLTDKRQKVIGKAYIDEGRCLAWAEDTPCIVCEEMCPLPEKAIWLEERSVLLKDGHSLDMQLPHVERERCIGCGICEYKCPLVGKAAIQVQIA